MLPFLSPHQRACCTKAAFRALCRNGLIQNKVCARREYLPHIVMSMHERDNQGCPIEWGDTSLVQNFDC